MKNIKEIIEELENCLEGDDEYALGLIGDLKEYLDMLNNSNKINNPWIVFEGNETLFDMEYRKNCECLFDNGEICHYDDEHPYAIMTHFRRVIQ